MTHFAIRWLVYMALLITGGMVGASPANTSTQDTSMQMQTDGKLRIRVNSGVCETTGGVGQVSGYIDVDKDTHIFFWFFEARNSPDTAPLTIWLNGGPGCSSMLGVFVENGPCTVNSDRRSTTLNPYSWNRISNMLYLDQPIGAGFSFGSAKYMTTADSAPKFWLAMQAWLLSKQFSKFQGRRIIFAGESYAAHYAAVFIPFFDARNKEIENGKLGGVKVEFKAMMMSDGKYDPLIQFKSYIDFAANAPGYGPLQKPDVIQQMNASYYTRGGCKDRLDECYSSRRSARADTQCYNANRHCTRTVYDLAVKGREPNDLRQAKGTRPKFPPTNYLHYIRSPDVTHRIGAEGKYDQCNKDVRLAFSLTGELGRGVLQSLGQIVASGLPTLFWAGDADIKANWVGIHASVCGMKDWPGSSKFFTLPFSNLTLSGKPVAAVKVLDNLSFARVYGAGHALPAFQPAAAFEIFSRFLQGQSLTAASTT